MKLPPSSDPNRNPHGNWPHDFKLPLNEPARSLGDLMVEAEHYAGTAMRQHGRVPPTLFGLGAEGPFMVIPESMTDNAAKIHYVNTARLICVASDARAVALVVEAWARFAKPGESLDPHELPSEAMDRREVVMIIGEARGVQKQKFLPILRTDAGGFFGFGPYDGPKFDSTEGRFARILPPLKPKMEHRLLAKFALQAQGIILEGPS